MSLDASLKWVRCIPPAPSPEITSSVRIWHTSDIEARDAAMVSAMNLKARCLRSRIIWILNRAHL